MAEITHDFTTVPIGVYVEDHIAALVARNAWDADKFEGFDPIGWIERNGVDGGLAGVILDDTFTYPNGDYRVSIDYESASGQGYRVSWGAAARIQSDNSCYYVDWNGNTDGIAIFRYGGGQYATRTKLQTEAVANGSVSTPDPTTRLWLGIRCTGTGSTVTIQAFNTKTGVALFSYDDTAAERIVGDGKAGFAKGDGPTTTGVARLYALHIDDQAGAAVNLGIRVNTDSDDSGTAYPDEADVLSRIYTANGQTFLGPFTSSVVGGKLQIDSSLFDGASVDDLYYVSHFDSSGNPIGHNYYNLVNLDNANDFSDD